MNTRDDFIAAVTRRRGPPDEVQHSKGGLALRYGRAFVAANDREIRMNEGADWDWMIKVRLAHAKGLNR